MNRADRSGQAGGMDQMNSIRSWLKGAALVGVGALAAVGASRVHVSFAPSQAVAASPPATMQPALPPPSQSQVADAKAFSRTFAQVAEQLKPAVVSIVVEKGGNRERMAPNARRFQRRGGGGGQGANPFQGTPFEHFFGSPFGPGGDGDDGPGPMPRQVGAGSGVVIDT